MLGLLASAAMRLETALGATSPLDSRVCTAVIQSTLTPIDAFGGMHGGEGVDCLHRSQHLIQAPFKYTASLTHAVQ